MRLKELPRRLAVVLSVLVALVAGTTTAAQARAAWDCPVGDVCVWSGYDGTGQRCNWANADNNWHATPIVCSWARNYDVKSYYNRGQSTAYTGVMLYYSTGYQNLWTCAKQGSRFSFIPSIGGGARLGSHRWESGFPYCS